MKSAFIISFAFGLFMGATTSFAAPTVDGALLSKRATDTKDLPQEVQDSAKLFADVTRDPSIKVTGGLDDFVFNPSKRRLSEIDFGKSKKSPLGFALDTFPVEDPANGPAQERKEQLALYLALEFDLRKNGGGKKVTETKVVKFFLQFQLQRMIDAGQTIELGGKPLKFNGGVEHQRQKVLKNAKSLGTAEELAAVKAIAG